MKFTKYFMPFAALAVLASCSNDNLVDNPTNQPGETLKGTAYVAINISMPDVAGSRAEDVTLTNGDPEEYAVADGAVYLFKASSADDANEDGYEFVAEGNLGTTIWDDQAEGNHVTSKSRTAVATFDGASLLTTGNYYALVILNKPDGFTTPGENDDFGTWKESIIQEANVKMSTSAGFTMTNAPLLNGGKVTTLVPIDASKIQTTPNNLVPAADIFVQRVAAKVSFDYDEAITVSNTEGKDKVELDGWALSYTNKTSYPVQLANNYVKNNNSTTWFVTSSAAPDYFISSTTFSGNSKTYNRVYWAEDPNYDKTYSSTGVDPSTAFTIIDNTALTNGMDKALYCLENTMTYSSMLQNQTTRFVLAATYWAGGIPEQRDAATKAPSFVATDSWKATIKDLNNNAKTVAQSQSDVNYLTFNASEAQSGVALTSVVTLTTDGKNAYKEYLNTGKSSGDEGYVDGELNAEQIKAGVLYYIGLSSDVSSVNFYYEGKMYYAAPILHFDGVEKPTEGTGVEKYKEEHLGRFGIVRNNWYVLTINSITGLGEPTAVPTPGDGDPDDPDKQYIQFSINILSWAKRTSGYDL